MVIMRKDTPLCEINLQTGIVTDLRELPLDLFLEENTELDTRINNITNMNHWCASRVLSLDRIHAKAILNSCALSQSQTDQEKAKIALSYKCLSLHDSYWVKTEEHDNWKELNLFDHSLNGAVDVALQGKNLTLNNTMMIASDCATDGIAPKAWICEKDGLYMLKGNLPGTDSVKKEVEASKILQKLGFDVLNYDYYTYHKDVVAKSKCYTTKDISQISLEAYEENHSFLKDASEEDIYQLHILNLCDYLTGNADRHWGNINFLYDDRQMLGFAQPMDFNHCFEATPDNRCLPVKYIYKTDSTQLNAAIEAVKYTKVQIPDIELAEFDYGNFVIQNIQLLKQNL